MKFGWSMTTSIGYKNDKKATLIASFLNLDKILRSLQPSLEIGCNLGVISGCGGNFDNIFRQHVVVSKVRPYWQ